MCTLYQCCGSGFGSEGIRTFLKDPNNWSVSCSESERIQMLILWNETWIIMLYKADLVCNCIYRYPTLLTLELEKKRTLVFKKFNKGRSLILRLLRKSKADLNPIVFTPSFLPPRFCSYMYSGTCNVTCIWYRICTYFHTLLM